MTCCTRWKLPDDSTTFCLRPHGHRGPCLDYFGLPPNGRVWLRNEQDDETLKAWHGFLDAELALKPKKKWGRPK